MNALLNWLNQRTGYRRLIHLALFESIPGGARWRYVWGSTLLFTFSVQLVTGIFLWCAYSPSAQTAWESVNYIEYEMSGGWLLRGLHHYTAHVMVVLLVLHFVQVMVDRAYQAPREVNYWFGLILMSLVLGLALTGYLLPWDQKGFWATKVVTNLMAMVPLIGPGVQRLMVGGSEYGHHTLTRFFAMHAGILPGLMIVMIVWHIFLFRRHGITAKEPYRKPEATFWPNQFLLDAVACLVVMAIVLFLIMRHGFGDASAHMGAPLGAPADPSVPYSAARPEWYFLFLYQLLKYFPGKWEIWGAIVIPGLVGFALFLSPILGRWQLGHLFNLVFVFALLAGVGLLTVLALVDDRQNPVYQAAVTKSDREASRVRVLAQSPSGIPPQGAVSLLRNDPYTQGPRLFAAHCAGCHRYDGHNGLGDEIKDEPSASDLKGFGSRQWLSGFFDPQQIATHKFFGGTAFKDGKMASFVTKEVASYELEQQRLLEKVITTLSAEAALFSQRDLDQRDEIIIQEGHELFGNDGLMCLDCHQFHGEGPSRPRGPELTGYGSRDWIMGIMHDPTQVKYYGKRNDGMPAFGREGRLDPNQIGLIADWLRGDWLVDKAAVP